MVDFFFFQCKAFCISFSKKLQHAFAKAALIKGLGRKTKSRDRTMILIQTKLLKGQEKLQL